MTNRNTETVGAPSDIRRLPRRAGAMVAAVGTASALVVGYGAAPVAARADATISAAAALLASGITTFDFYSDPLVNDASIRSWANVAAVGPDGTLLWGPTPDEFGRYVYVIPEHPMMWGSATDTLENHTLVPADAYWVVETRPDYYTTDPDVLMSQEIVSIRLLEPGLTWISGMMFADTDGNGYLDGEYNEFPIFFDKGFYPEIFTQIGFAPPPGHQLMPLPGGGTPPGDGDTPPGDGDTPPGDGDTPPGDGDTPPGDGGTPDIDALASIGQMLNSLVDIPIIGTLFGPINIAWDLAQFFFIDGPTLAGVAEISSGIMTFLEPFSFVFDFGEMFGGPSFDELPALFESFFEGYLDDLG